MEFIAITSLKTFYTSEDQMFVIAEVPKKPGVGERTS